MVRPRNVLGGNGFSATSYQKSIRGIFGIFIVCLFWSSVVTGADISTYLAGKKGQEFLESNDSAKALDVYSGILASGEESGEVYNNLGQVFLKEGDTDKAKAYFNEALKRLEGKKKAEVYYNLGNAALGNADLQEAQKMYQEALSINPDDLDAKYNMEQVLLLMQEKPPQSEQENPQDDKQKPEDEAEKERQKQKEQEQEQREQAQQVLESLEQQEQDARDDFLDGQQPELPPSGMDW